MNGVLLGQVVLYCFGSFGITHRISSGILEWHTSPFIVCKNSYPNADTPDYYGRRTTGSCYANDSEKGEIPDEEVGSCGK